jgi:glycosyltransferase involved in cell wall biosynthesis
LEPDEQPDGQRDAEPGHGLIDVGAEVSGGHQDTHVLQRTRHDGGMPPLRVAYTLEQCWHDVPGGTAVASLRVLDELVRRDDVELIGVAGRHRRPPDPTFRPTTAVASLPLARPWLYESWNRLGWPKVERATGRVDVCHSTVAIPAATDAPHVVTVHDVAFIHTPERFTGHGARVMAAGLERCRAADLVLCPTAATAADLVSLRFDERRIRVVPWGVDVVDTTADERERARRDFALPERFVLFVGTIEPRKNLPRLAEAISRLGDPMPLVVAGAAGWGDVAVAPGADVRFAGFVPHDQLAALYSQATVFAYPSLQEGFGMPILEAMAAGTPVVTSRGGATDEAAAGAAVLVDPGDVDSIAAGLDEAVVRRDELVALGHARVVGATWAATAESTVAAYREVAG